MQGLREKIQARSARVVVIGVATAGFTVTGYDKDREKIRLLGPGESYIGDIPSSVLKPLIDSG